MKNIHLFTGNNELLQELLVNLDCIPVPHAFSVSESLHGLPEEDILLFHISDTSLEQVEKCIAKNPACACICISGELTEVQKEFLLRNGIACLLETASPYRIAEYIEAFLAAGKPSAGKILIYDDRKNQKRFFGTVLSLFGYEPVFTDSIKHFFDSLENDTFRFFLLNLSSDGFDLLNFLKKCYSASQFSTTPLIVYKDMSQGILAQEALSGLNRYTSCIYSPEEVYRLLLDLMFQKELIPFVMSLSDVTGAVRFSSWDKKSLEQIYYENRYTISELSGLAAGQDLEAAGFLLREINTSFLKASSLQWLKKLS